MASLSVRSGGNWPMREARPFVTTSRVWRVSRRCGACASEAGSKNAAAKAATSMSNLGEPLEWVIGFVLCGEMIESGPQLPYGPEYRRAQHPRKSTRLESSIHLRLAG